MPPRTPELRTPELRTPERRRPARRDPRLKRFAKPLAAILLGIATSGCVIQERVRPSPYFRSRAIETSRAARDRLELAGHEMNDALRHTGLSELPAGKWFLPADESNVRGVAVLASGLNNDPSSIEAYAHILTSRGVAAFVTTLTHQGDRLHGASLELWVDELDAAWTHAGARYPDVPMFQVAYSTGATATLVHAHQKPDPRRQGMILAAPAIKLRAYAYAARLITWLRGHSLVFPSRIPARYRAHRFTSWDSYGALFDGVDLLSDVEESEALARVPAVVVMSPGDELLSYRGAEAWATERSLPWEFVPVRSERGYQHLILDDSCGTETWGRIRDAVHRHVDDVLRP